MKIELYFRAKRGWGRKAKSPQFLQIMFSPLPNLVTTSVHSALKSRYISWQTHTSSPKEERQFST
jgi:hypothetical protein